MRKKRFVTTSMMTLALLTMGTTNLETQVSGESANVTSGMGMRQIDEAGELPNYSETPQATALFPKTLLEWHPETDPNALFNVSKVPLAPRVKGEKVNEYQSEEAKVLSIAIVNKNTLGTPSQGSGDKAVYNFTNWQYVDTLVAWAGSAGEGIIVPPSGDMIDASHRNGVPILGTVFFPPNAYGGKEDWVKDFVKKDDSGAFIVADKLLEMSDYYGFDGWFINEETDVDADTAKELQELLVYLQEHKKEENQIVWYDSMIPNGNVYWQGALNDQNKMYFQNGEQRVSDSMFIDFRWSLDRLKSSREKAKELKRDPFDLYSGVDVQANGTNSGRSPENILDEQGQLTTSIGLYCPDWTLRDGGNYDVETYWKNEQKFWTNGADDPRQVSPTDNNWYGVSKYVVEKTPVTSFPFVTTFNVGNGDNYYQQGTIVKKGTFNNRSEQDILPTYRWIIDNQTGNHLTADFNYEDAYNGGSSILLSGEMAADTQSYIKLYASDLPVTGKETATVVTKGASKIDLVVETTENDKTTTIRSEKREQAGKNGWEQDVFDLSKLKGKTIKTIGLNVYGKESGQQTIRLGSLMLGDTKSTSDLSEINSVSVIGKTIQDDLTESVRLSWQTTGENIKGYNIYRENEGQESMLVGSTSNTSFVLLDQKRSEGKVKYSVVPKDVFGREHQNLAKSVSYEFDPLKAPTINFNATSTFVAAGETITLNAITSPSTEEIKWEVNDGSIVSQEDNQAVVRFDKPGVYTIIAHATNQAGTTNMTKEQYIHVYDQASPVKVENLSVLSGVTPIEGSGYTNEGESYQFALDGNLTTKWCDNSSDHPYMVVDLGDVKTITGFSLYNAEAGGENPEWNTKDYDILVSKDNKEWETVVTHRNNKDAISLDAISKTEARYVKLAILKAEQTGNTVRLYDFHIVGIDGKDIDVVENGVLINQLRDSYYQGKSKSPENYTEESFAHLTAAMAEAEKALYENGTQNELEQAYTHMQAALEGLVEVEQIVSKEPLKELVTQAKQYDSENYTVESYDNLTRTIADAERILMKADVSSAEIIIVTAQLEEAIQQLELASEAIKQQLLDELEIYVAAGHSMDLIDMYTSESIDAFNDSLQKADNYLKDNNVIQTRKLTKDVIQNTESQLIQLIDSAKQLRLKEGQTDNTQFKEFEQAAIKALALDNTKYTPESYRLMRASVNRIYAIASQEETNTGLSHFGNAIVSESVTSLVLDEGQNALAEAKVTLKQTIDAVELFLTSTEVTDYEPESVEALKNELEKAKKAIDSSSIDEVKQATEDLELAISELIPVDHSLAIAKTHLKESITQLEKIDVSKESDKTKKEVNNLVDEANRLLNNEQATLTEVEEMTGKVLAKIDDLTDTQKEREMLVSLIQLMSGVSSEGYTETSYHLFADALKQAEKIALDEQATKEQIVTATHDLNKAYEGLEKVPVVDKSELLALIKQAEQLNKEAFTEETYVIMLDALEQAKLVASNPKATEQDVLGALTALQEGIDQLKSVNDSPVTGSTGGIGNGGVGTKPQTTGSLPKTGEGSSIYVAVSGLGLLTAAIVMFLKKRKQG